MTERTAIFMTVEGVKTRISTNEALLTLSVPLEEGALISKFLSRVGDKVGVAFADVDGTPLVNTPGDEPLESPWKKLSPLTQSAITLCKEPIFQQFVVDMQHHPGELPSEAGAARYIRAHCKVESRRDLERVDGARERFGDLMARYREWQNRDGRRAHQAR